MEEITMRHHLLAAILFSALSTATLASTEEPRQYPRLCAELDLAVISDIESAAHAQQISGEKLAAAFFSVMNARNACDEGRHNEAIAIYRGIAFD
jgi:hypothetical protein